MSDMKFELSDDNRFSELLYERMKLIDPTIEGLELYEFRYALKNMRPSEGWDSVIPEQKAVIETRVNSRTFYDAIQIKPKSGDRIILDQNISILTNMLFVGLVTGDYSPEWINHNFYFDIRSFMYFHRTRYFSKAVLNHLGDTPFCQFDQKQKNLTKNHEIGYREFKEANAEIDELFIRIIQKLIATRGTPILIAIAGPTAAGKTEIVERLNHAFENDGQKTTSIELDNFLTDRDYREEKGIHTQGKQALHFELLKSSLVDLCRGNAIIIPRYDFVFATSSHDLNGNLKPDGIPIKIEPADIIFIEGNFPFLIDEIASLIQIKVVYLTDDPMRMKRKWRRDIDYRKKYEPTYFRNRFFKEQFIMSEIAYIPQMETCDLVVDTTDAAIWATSEMKHILNEGLI